MPTTYLWQHRLPNKCEDHRDRERDDMPPQVQEFAKSGAMDSLFEELHSTDKNVDLLVRVILKHLGAVEPRDRPAVARHVFRTTWGQGILREAAEMALRWVT